MDHESGDHQTADQACVRMLAAVWARGRGPNLEPKYAVRPLCLRFPDFTTIRYTDALSG